MAVFYAASAALGLIIGSFLNVCIYRLPMGKSIVYPPSACPSCGTHIRAWQNIPVISWIMLKGRCAQCGEGISPVYPAVELLNALCYVAALYRFGPTAKAAVVMALLSAFIVVTFIDIRHRIIPNEITVPGILLGLVLGPLLMDIRWTDSIIGMLVGGLPLLLIGELYRLIRKKEAMGGGDIKLMGMVGAFIGWEAVLFSIFMGSLIGSIGGVTQVAINIKMEHTRKNVMLQESAGSGNTHGKHLFSAALEKLGNPIPFGPYLVVGTVLSIFFRNEILTWYFGLFV